MTASVPSTCNSTIGYRELMELRVVRLTTAFDAACHFYGDLLGWPITHEWPASNGGGRGRLFGYGDTARIELIESEIEDPASGFFLSVAHPDVVALHDRLRATGVFILRPLSDTPWGHRAFAALDPTGIELVHFQVLHPENEA
jgi:catechol 2,3-dioxygenase-like lactoylglutathione lyase family enzyme